MVCKLPILFAFVAIGAILAAASGPAVSQIQPRNQAAICASPIAVIASPTYATPSATLDELQLLDAMLANHASAIALANNGLQNGRDSQVRRMALRVAESQVGEVQLLRAWRSAWYPDAAQLTIPAREFELLRCAPPEAYDRVFLETMLATFQEAIELATITSVNADHVEFRTYALSLVKARQSEISIMREWLLANQSGFKSDSN